MPQIEGTSRHQMQIFALEQAISMDNPVRVIDAFVSTLSLEELKNCSEEGITTYVAPKEANHNKKEGAYQKRQFTYDTETDTYTCPKGEVLETNGRWYTKNKGKGRRPYRIKRYQLPYKTCSACPVKEQCVGNGLLKQRHGRAIERSEYE